MPISSVRFAPRYIPRCISKTKEKLEMHILYPLIIVLFHFFSIGVSFAISDTTVSGNEQDLFSTDAVPDTPIFQTTPVVFPSDTYSDTQISDNRPILDSDSLDFLDGHDTVTDAGAVATRTDLDPEIVADESCPPAGSQPNGKMRARGIACGAPWRFTNEIEGSEGEPDRLETPSEMMRKFNRRPLVPGQTMDDMCGRFVVEGRFMRALFPVPVCSSGKDRDVTRSKTTHVDMQLVDLFNCNRGMSVNLFPPLEQLFVGSWLFVCLIK